MIWLAACVLVIASPHLSADITLTSRLSDALTNAFADGLPPGDTPPAQIQTDFLPAHLSNSATESDRGNSASANTVSNSSIAFDSVGETLRVTGDGTASASVLKGEELFSGPSASTLANVISLTFSLTSSSDYTLSGLLTGEMSDCGCTTGGAGAELIGPDGFIFQVNAGKLSVGDFPTSVTLSESGTLPPGTYTFTAFVATHIEMFSRVGSLTTNGGANFDFNIGGVTPTPIQWDNPAGGSFHTATNWDPEEVPGSGDTAVFGLQAVYTVDVGTATTNRLEIRDSDLTFTNANYTVATTDFVLSGTVLDNASLTLESGSLKGIHALIGESFAARVDVMADAVLIYTGSLQVGGAGDGFLTVLGTVSSGEGRIGSGVGDGTATLSGAVAGWLSGNLSVGFTSNGTLTLEQGGAVFSLDGFLGFEADSDGTVNITGDPLISDPDPQTNWTCANLTIGNNGTGLVTAEEQGEVIVTSQLTVGQAGGGSFRLLGGAQGSAHDITAGEAPGSFGEMVVGGKSGAGPSSLSAEQNLVLGLEGDGVLIIREDAVVTCFDAALGVLAGSSGVASLGEDGAAGAPARWVVDGDMTLGGLAPGTIALHNSATVSVGFTLFIEANGSIGGNGTFSAQTVVRNNGGNGPGNSVGTLILESDYEQTGAGKLTIETEGLGDGEFDVLHVTGNATLDGTLEMFFLGGYLPKAGDSWNFLEVEGTISGEFAEVIFPQLLPGFQFDTIQTADGLVFSAINDAVLAPTFLLNISTRLQVGLDENVLIGGFILLGTEPKRVLIRAVGPSLETAGVVGAMADPTLELHDSTGAIVGTNDNWRTTQLGGLITDDQFLEIHATGIPPTNNAESTIIATLDPGAYTAIIAGANGTTGIGLAEVYDLGPAAAPAKLANISTRGFVQTGDNVMIGGFIVGNQTSQVLVRGIGPSLAGAGIGNALADPMLELHDINGALLAVNDNWRSDQEGEIEATTLQPNDDLESAILRSLAPGAYTAILRGVSDGTGVGLVEAYNLD